MAPKRQQEFKQSVLFCLQEEHRPKCNGRVSLGEPYERQEARYMNFLDPRIFIAKKETSAEKLTCILHIMSEDGRISDNECDKVMLQFNHFHDNSLTADSEAFKGFSMETGRVDTFYFDRLSNKADFKELWKVVKLLLALSHGQATVERGFSSNKEVMVENLAQHSLVAQRVICDHVRSVNHRLVSG